MPRLRPLQPEDRAKIVALNAANVELLAPMTEQRLDEIAEVADRFDVVEVDGAFGGFVVTVAPGTSYDSENYRWFDDRYGSGFYYLDRIVLDPALRRRGLGSFVYDELEEVARGHGRLALEVNLVPPNPASLAFHRGRGYVEVGRLGDEEHMVSLMEKPLR